MPLIVTYRCPHCGESCRHGVSESTAVLTCASCHRSLRTTPSAIQEGHVTKCLVCPSSELFIRKNFPQRLGVGIVALGFALSCVAWFYHLLVTTFAILFATALIDVVLYVLLGEVLECYRCHAQYYGDEDLTQHDAFDLEVHERHRQMQARLAAFAETASDQPG